MGLGQLDFDNKNKVEIAIERLRTFEPPEGYYLSFSGGKDSMVIYDLAIRAGVKFDAHYNMTGIDPPELVYFIRKNYPGVLYEKPLENIWKLVEAKGLPRRNARFCCEYLKEHSGAGRVVLTGVRWQESVRRQSRKMVEVCRNLKSKSFVHPIIDWTASQKIKNGRVIHGGDVWEYIKGNGLPYCGLYDDGFKRLGCVLCPMTSKLQAQRDIGRWPKIADAWRRAAGRFYDRGTEGVARWGSAQEMFEWWISRKKIKTEPAPGEDAQGMFL